MIRILFWMAILAFGLIRLSKISRNPSQKKRTDTHKQDKKKTVVFVDRDLKIMDEKPKNPKPQKKKFTEIKGHSKEEAENYFRRAGIPFESVYEDEFSYGCISDNYCHVLIFTREDILIEIYRPDR